MSFLHPSASDAPLQNISDVIRDLLEKAGSETRVSVGRVLHVFGVRGFALLLLVLSLLNIVIFMVPLISILFGVPMVILAVQMVLGLKAPIFPAALRRQSIPRSALMSGGARVVGWVAKIESYIKPRFLFLSSPWLIRVHGVVLMLLAVMVTVPVPLFNVPPSLGIAFMAIGLLQRDGLFIVAAYAVAAWCLILFQSLGHVAHSLTHAA